MYEFHGWVTIRESPGEQGEDQQLLERLVADFRAQIRSYNWTSGGALLLDWFNGAYHVLASGLFNHADSRAVQLLELFTAVAERAPGSYGLVYVHDDEVDDLAARNRFQVWVLARGRLYYREDPFLSPYVPTVEDSYQTTFAALRGPTREVPRRAVALSQLPV